MRRFFPSTALALASLALASTFPAAAAEMAVAAPYNLVMEGRLADATLLTIDIGDKEARPIELTVVDGQLLEAISIPASKGRRIELRAQNADGKVLYEGALEVDIGTDYTPQVSAELKSALDGSPGELTLASHRVAVEFAAVERDGKPFTRMTADVFDAMGSRLEVNREELAWDVDDPWLREHALACPGSGGHTVCAEFEPRKPDGIQVALNACFRGGICRIEFFPPATPVWRMVTVGLGAHACALKLDGRAYCWGEGELGQLGYDAPKHCSPYGNSGSDTGCGLWPQEVQCTWGPCRFTDISAGKDHTCAIDVDRHAWCWGDNADGALGLGVFSYPPSTGVVAPHLVVGNQEYRAIRAGQGATCALTTGGQVYCWGSNHANLVPTNTHRWLESPELVNLPELVDALDFSNLHACATTADGKLYCWGSNSESALGPRVITNNVPCANCPAVPLLMQGLVPELATGDRVNLVAAGVSGTCAHLGNAQTTCWGRSTPAFPGALPLKRLTRGTFHYCAIAAGSSVFPDMLQCAGAGELGDGGSHPQPGNGPVRVVTPVKHFKDVDAGDGFTCAIGVDKQEDVYCWGDGTFGRLGLGNPDYRVDVPTALRFPVPIATPKFPRENWRR